MGLRVLEFATGSARPRGRLHITANHPMIGESSYHLHVCIMDIYSPCVHVIYGLTPVFLGSKSPDGCLLAELQSDHTIGSESVGRAEGQ